MAREKSWFVGRPKKRGDNATRIATPPGENTSAEVLGRLANQLETGASIGGPDLETERDPPVRALEIIFPKANTANPVRWSDDHPPPDYQRLFANITRPEAILTGHLKALNFDHRSCFVGDILLPLRDDNASYIPTKASTDKKFTDRLAELDITNDAAFRALSKTTKPGAKAPRLMNMRKFWTHLDNVSQYWDTTADQYYSIELPIEAKEPNDTASTKSVERYKGRRTANGHDMPDAYRADTVNAFVEGATNAFNCRVSPPYVLPRRLAPTLQVQRLEQPVRVTSVVMRLPADRDRARAGIMEGPLMGVLERNTIDFGSLVSTKTSSRKSEHDLLREIGAMLYIAQQRAHKKQDPSAQDESKWYATKPRWGGGSGGRNPELQRCEDEHAEIVARIAGSPPNVKELEALKVDARKRLKKAYDNAQAWMKVKSGASLWHEKTEYKAIGKPPGSTYDEIFLVSCLFHHISILKLTIHDAYTHYLTTGAMPEQTPAEEDWCSPRLERTDWYDLLNQEQRVDAFRYIWGVMEYLNRDATTQSAIGLSKSDAAQTLATRKRAREGEQI